MSLSDVAIGRPVFTTMMSMALLVLGLLSLGSLPTDQFPPVNFPFMLIRVIYPGAGPEDIERDVVEPMEDAISSVPGIKQLQSFTRDNATVLVAQFEMGTSQDEAANQVRQKVDSVRGELPSGAEDPVIQQIDLGALPVLVFTLAGPGSVNETRAIVDERLKPAMEQINGVGSVNIVGGQDREIQVDLDLDQLAALNLPFDQIAQRIGIENLSLPVGQYDSHGYTVGVRADARYRSVEDLARTVVATTRDGRPILLREVATLTDSFARANRYVRLNQRDALSIEIIKKSGGNTIEVVKAAQERLKEIVPTLGQGYSYDVIIDQSLDIEANAHEVWIAIYFGGAMAVLVILFFLLDLRGTIISAMALPTSIIGTFAVMSWMGFSLNTMTLLGMSLAIGLLIDDAVVVREAITKRLEQGESPRDAAANGTREIALAVMATTFSLVAVFVPVAFMQGMVGQFFKQFGLTITVSVLLSLFVAFTLDPMLSSRFSARIHHGKRAGIAGAIERFLDGMDAAYRRVLDWVIHHPYLTFGSALLSLVFTGVVAAFLPAEFIGKEDRGEVQLDVRLPVGTSLEETNEAARAVEADLLAIPGAQRVYTIIGFEDQLNRMRFRVRFPPKSERSEGLAHFEDAVRAAGQKVPSAEVTIPVPGVIDGLGDYPPLMIIVQGSDLDVLQRESTRIRDFLRTLPASSDVRLNTNPGKPELRVDIDRAVAADMGVPAGLVGVTARSLVEGQLVGALRDGGPEADIRLRAAPRFSTDAAAIGRLPLLSPRGLISVEDVADVKMGVGPSEIQHFNRLRAISIVSQVANGHALGDITGPFNEYIAKNPLPNGYFYTIDGQAKDMVETAAAMGLAIVVAGLFIFMVLASQFESFVHPFTLMMSVPLAMVGAILALAMTGSSLSMGSQIGIILLMGLVTKNAILLVDGALTGIREGLEPEEAMRLAGPRRLRPIVMTSAAMVLGMLPTAINTGVGSEFRAPMAIAVIGGVISSTLLTLLVIPVIFLWFERRRRGLSRLTQRFFPDQDHTPAAPVSVGEGDEGGAAAK